MAHFLEVGSLRDGVQEILENSRWLRQLLAMSPAERTALEAARQAKGDVATYHDSVRMALGAILSQAEEMTDFLDRFESAPVIYTGPGRTSEVLAMLERLIAQRDASQG